MEPRPRWRAIVAKISPCYISAGHREAAATVHAQSRHIDPRPGHGVFLHLIENHQFPGRCSTRNDPKAEKETTNTETEKPIQRALTVNI